MANGWRESRGDLRWVAVFSEQVHGAQKRPSKPGEGAVFPTTDLGCGNRPIGEQDVGKKQKILGGSGLGRR